MNLRNVFVRIYPQKIWNQQEEQILLDDGWSKVPPEISPGHSILMDINRTEDELYKSMSRNWKRNLRKSRKENHVISIAKSIDISDVLKVSNEMARSKNIEDVITEKELSSFLSTMYDKIIVAKCSNFQNELLSYRIIGVLGEKSI